MWTRTSPATPDDYFTLPIIAWTLADQNAPVNILRRRRSTPQWTRCARCRRRRKRIAAVTVLGETHDVFPSLMTAPPSPSPPISSPTIRRP